MGRVDGKVALITGAARGQGRSHALRLAEEGADIVAVDACTDLPTVPYPGATEADLATTAAMVQARGRRILAHKADVRDSSALRKIVAEAVAQLGHVDIVCANAGIVSFGPTWELTDEAWQEVIDVNLTGVWKTARAAIPHMIARGAGGSIILTSSVAGLVGSPNLAHYASAKHGLVGLMRTLAVELAPHSIRVNSVHPTTVDTPMVDNDPVRSLFLPGAAHPSKNDAEPRMRKLNALPVPWLAADDVSNAVLWLASDEARYVTGAALPIDAGATAPAKLPHR
ncbi:mycofactocin-coupled SDR family oxidoreductase [Pseudonocardia acaciae]|uniref:mycofactocin-coupled SDR family oxidoreductase n=1 Tax=Pseudonocardia acaciae TaxID=551276 RepID=UPI00048B866B|nr:mycofactocin-coupled SDR family oxidoreductase [Pseudonocardia acaciae]